MRNRLLDKIFARIVFMTVVFAVVSGGLSSLLFWVLWSDAYLVVIGAVAIGSLAGLTVAGIGAYSVLRGRKMEITTREWEGEPIVRQGPVNYFIHGDEADSWTRAYILGQGLGGWLILTKTHIVLRTHWGVYQRDPLVIPRADIENISVQRGSMAILQRLMLQRLMLHLVSGRVETFMVDDPEAWATDLREE